MRKRWIVGALALVVAVPLVWFAGGSALFAPGDFAERVAEMRARGERLDVADFEASVAGEPSPGVVALADISRRWSREHPDWAEGLITEGLSECPIEFEEAERLLPQFDEVRADVAAALRALEEDRPDLGGPAPPAYLNLGLDPFLEFAAIGSGFVLYEALAVQEAEGPAAAVPLHLRNARALLTYHDRLPYRSSLEADRVNWVRGYGLASLRAALLSGAKWEASEFDGLDDLLARERYDELTELLLYERAVCVAHLEKPIPDDVGWATRGRLRRDASAWLDFLDRLVAAHAAGPRALKAFDAEELELLAEPGLLAAIGDARTYADWEHGSHDNPGLQPILRSVLMLAGRRAIREDADARLGRVAVLAKRHLDEHGEFPDSLDALGARLPHAERLRHPVFESAIQLVVEGPDAVEVAFVPPSSDDPLLESRWVRMNGGPEPWRVVR